MVNTNGATISLKTIVFDNANDPYAIYRANGSSFISLVSSGTSASAINVVAGNHAMHADVTMNSSLNVDSGAASSLTFHTALSGGSSLSFTTTGAGTLFFASNSNYAGNTEIRSGLVSLLAGSTPRGSGTVNIFSGGTLDLNNRTLANTINAFSGGTLLDTGSSTAIHVSGTARSSGTTNGTINIQQREHGDFLGVVNRADVTISSGGTATFQNTVTEYGTVTSDADVVVQAGGRVRLVDTGGLNLGTTGSPGAFDLLGLTAGSYSLPSTASLAGMMR